MERHAGMAWCLTENKPATRSCASAGHDTGTLDSNNKRNEFLHAAPWPEESVKDIAEALKVGREAEKTNDQE